MSKNYKESFEQTKIAGNLAADTLDEVASYVKPGVTTDKLDKTFETESPYGGKVVKKGYTGKKELPLDKSKKKGSPRSYENVKKAKPLGKGRKNGVG